MTRQTTYATLEQMQQMEFGVTGAERTIDGVAFELLIGDNGLFGWAAKHADSDGNMVDWDRVSEDEAKQLGLPVKF
jgi:hypothetical protein